MVSFAVASAKGGVGKTTTSVNLGAALAGRGHRCVVVDVDLVMANVHDFLALDRDPEDGPTVHDVLAGEATVEAAAQRVSEGFDVVPGGTDLAAFAAADAGELGGVLGRLERAYDCVVLDTGAGVSYETVVPLELADHVVPVSTPRLSAVRDTKKTLELVERVGGSPAGLVLTNSGTGRSPSTAVIADFLGVELLSHVPEDGAIPAAQDAGQPVVAHAPESEAATAYEAAAAELEARCLGREVYGGRSNSAPSSTGS